MNINEEQWKESFENKLESSLDLGHTLSEKEIFENRIKRNFENLFSDCNELFVKYDLSSIENFLVDLLVSSKKKELHYETLDDKSLVPFNVLEEFHKKFDLLATHVGVSTQGEAASLPSRPVDLLTARNYVFKVVFDYCKRHQDMDSTLFFQFYHFPSTECPKHFWKMCFIADCLKKAGIPNFESVRYYTTEQLKAKGLSDAMLDTLTKMLKSRDMHLQKSFVPVEEKTFRSR